MKHYCEACKTSVIAFYNAEGHYFCEEHRPLAVEICSRMSEIRSRKWSVRGADSSKSIF